MKEQLTEHLRTIRQGRTTNFGGLTAVTLLGEPSGPDSVPWPIAVDEDGACITELGESASVNTLVVQNLYPKPLLLLDGEELIGAKQNRLVNLTVLVPPGMKIEIPVSCIEQGRWHHVSRAFGTRERMIPSSMRRTKAERVSRSLRFSGKPDADQGRVWQEVATYSRQRGVRSRTGALSDVLDVEAHRARDYVETIRPEAEQLGVAVYIGDRLAGLDLFGSPEAYAASHARLISSYAAEAIDATRGFQTDEPADTDLDPVTWLTEAMDGDGSTHEPPGMGTDLRIVSKGRRVAALWTDEGLVHLCAFPTVRGEG
jgi:hypothetical protein